MYKEYTVYIYIYMYVCRPSHHRHLLELIFVWTTCYLLPKIECNQDLQETTDEVKDMYGTCP